MSRMFQSGTNLALHGTGLAGVPYGRRTESTAEPLKKPGETLVWAAGTGAYQESKRGTVIAILPAGASLRDAITATGRAPVRVKVGDVAKSDRYVVEVQTVHGPAYFAPLVKTVDADLRQERELRKLPVEAWR